MLRNRRETCWPRRCETKKPVPQLYNLKEDPGEAITLVKRYPEKTEELIRKMHKFDANCPAHKR